jgi:hypothetical protein
VGHHVYGNHDNDWRKPYSGESWLSYCKRVGVEITLTKMFTSSEKLWFGYPLSQGRAVMCTEVGASIRYKYTPWNIAYVMRLLEYAEKHGVGATVFRTGYLSDKNIYEQKAKEYFGRSFHIAGNGSPAPDKSQSNSPAESTAMPVATFILSSASPLVDQTVTLDASRSYDLDGNIVSYKWTFGDGTTTSKTVPTTTHVYTEDGTYTIRLMITDNSGKTDTGTKIITVRRTTSSLSISISPNPTTTKAGTQIKGALATGGPNLDIKISYRKTGSQTWNTLATTKTNPDGYYSFRWFPTEAGDYELKANWPGDSTLLPAQTPVIAFVCQHIQTLITIHTSASSTIFGLNTSISGTLANMYGDPLEDENIVLSYRFRGVQNWILITSDKTDAAGNYSVAWVPTVTGYYVIKAEWSGNSTHNATNSTATLSSISYKDQILAVESNSSTSQLSYNGSSRSLSFLVTGPTDSRGYARITVAKTLIGNSSRVFLDGVEKNFSVLTGDDSWVLCIDYSHSVHQVVVYLDVAPIPEMPLFMFLPLFMILSGACTVLARKRLPSLRGT